MNPKSQQTNIANKIKKWLETAQQLRTEKTIFAISITRLTSIKSLCQDRIVAEKFAIYIAQRVQQYMNEISCPEHFTVEEWETYKTLVAEASAQMENSLGDSTPEDSRKIHKLLKEIDVLQGDDYRNVHWTTVHFVRSGDLLKIQYALRCFVDPDFTYWVYKLAREYVEKYDLQHGTGLLPKSVPMLLEVAEFWCQHYFGQSLSEKFPQFTVE